MGRSIPPHGTFTVTCLRSTNSYYWSAGFGGSSGKPTTGLATMGGGSLSVRSGGDFDCQAGTFGNIDSGNLSILSGGDVKGLFVARSGEGVIHAAGKYRIAERRTGDRSLRC